MRDLDILMRGLSSVYEKSGSQKYPEYTLLSGSTGADAGQCAAVIRICSRKIKYR